MARYIDADWIYQMVENRYRVSSGIEHRCERDLLDLICEAPTADVAPKSEVAREIDDLKRYIRLNEDIAIKCKQENGDQNEEYWKGKVSAFRQIRAYIDAELKKKYTEETEEKV